jgi:DHA1 family multidrug resistance protein-like MFS transporter
MFICIYLSILYAILYAFFEVFPLVFLGIRHFSEESNGLIFISLLIGFFFAVAAIVARQQPYEAGLRAKLPPGAPLPPEAKLQQALWAAFCPPIGLFIFAWTAPFPHIHWAAPCVGILLFGMGMMVIFTSLIPYIVGYSGRHAPLPLAAATATRAALGAGFPLFTIQMYKAITVQGATSLLAKSRRANS